MVIILELEIEKPLLQIILVEPACAVLVHVEEELLEKQLLAVLYKNSRDEGQQTFLLITPLRFEPSEGLEAILNGRFPFFDICKPFHKLCVFCSPS